MRREIVLLVWLTASGALFAQHRHGPAGSGEGTTAWTSQALLLVERGGERASSRVRVQGLPGASTLQVFGPAGGQRRVDLVDGQATVENADPGVGNYHWLLAREATDQHVGVASAVWYSGVPGPSPRRLLAQPMSELEIVPDPLPREHGSYRESEKWRFVVRFMGQPLAAQRLVMETANGSRLVVQTDHEGGATVLFPRDFRGATASGGHARRQAGFVLSTEHQADGRHFITSFNASYGEDADRDRSLPWGAAFGLLGMLSAWPLLRRRSTVSNKEKSC